MWSTLLVASTKYIKFERTRTIDIPFLFALPPLVHFPDEYVSMAVKAKSSRSVLSEEVERMSGD
jgi:hypothetical protein